jgi:hypothetical protein
MDIIDQYIAQKEDQLYRKLATVTDPEIRQLVSDLNTLKRTKEILRQSESPEQSLPLFQNGNGNSAASVPQMTQGDAAVAAIKRAGRPLHVDAILKALPDFGAKASKQVLVSVLLKDRRKRFVRTAPNTFDVRASDTETHNDSSSTGLGNGQSKSRSRLPAGFSLIESIKGLLPELKGEFSQPVVYELLCNKYPEAAPWIQKASIAAMLGKLAEREFIEVTDAGFGSNPRKYRRKGVY